MALSLSQRRLAAFDTNSAVVGVGVQVTAKTVDDGVVERQRGLPEAPYPPDIFSTEVQLAVDEVRTAYGHKGERLRGKGGLPVPQIVKAELAGHLDVNKVADDVVARILANPPA